jgi:hypothetical protein
MDALAVQKSVGVRLFSLPSALRGGTLFLL